MMKHSEDCDVEVIHHSYTDDTHTDDDTGDNIDDVNVDDGTDDNNDEAI